MRRKGWNLTTREKLIKERGVKPLGMRGSNLNVSDTLGSPDYSKGYNYDEDTKETRQLPMRDFPQVAAAGAINSNARDMAQWLRLMLGGGAFEGKRLVSEANFAELLKPQMKVAGNIHYGLGWMLREWRGHKVVENGGNIDGFNAQVALMPDQRARLRDAHERLGLDAPVGGDGGRLVEPRRESRSAEARSPGE